MDKLWGIARGIRDAYSNVKKNDATRTRGCNYIYWLLTNGNRSKELILAVERYRRDSEETPEKYRYSCHRFFREGIYRDYLTEAWTEPEVPKGNVIGSTEGPRAPNAIGWEEFKQRRQG